MPDEYPIASARAECWKCAPLEWFIATLIMGRADGHMLFGQFRMTWK